MNLRLLAIIGIIGAPFLMIDTLHNGLNPDVHSSLSGVFNLIYISAWMCSIVALKKLGALGTSKWAKALYSIQMVFLFMANVWNLYETIQPGANTFLYKLLDPFWPFSNLCMLATGITIAVRGNLRGWKRFVPLVVGLWLPVALVAMLIYTRTPAVLLFVTIYSALAWTTLGIAIYLATQEFEQKGSYLQFGSAAIQHSK